MGYWDVIDIKVNPGSDRVCHWFDVGSIQVRTLSHAFQSGNAYFHRIPVMCGI